MKQCVSCGRVQEGNNKFCVSCGGQEFGPVQQVKKKKTWLIVLIALVIVAAVAVGAFLLLFDPVGDFAEELRGGNYDAAMDILDKHIYENPERRDEAFQEFSLWLDELYGQFVEQAISYDELTVHLEELQEFGMHQNRITEIHNDAADLQYLRDT